MTLRSAIYVFVSLLLMFPTASHAYIDPGAGSILIQVVLGTLAAAGFFFKVYYKRIKRFFGKSREEE